MHMSRREALLSALFGTGWLGLRALASGIAPTVLANPRLARAAGPAAKPQFLIMSTSAAGDPMGCNAPGTYDDPTVLHPPHPCMTPTPVTLGERTYTAAAPWSTLLPPLRQRTCFVHHATSTVVHPDAGKVMGLMGATENHAMWVSLLAAQLAPLLGTVQNVPVSLGAATAAEALRGPGGWLPMLRPTGLAALLRHPEGPLVGLEPLREATLGRLVEDLRATACPGQKKFLDTYAQSQAQLRCFTDELLNELHAIHDDSPQSQLKAAVVLVKMRVAPVVVVHVPFGGDNHADPDLRDETVQTGEGVAAINALGQQLEASAMADRVTFALHNVFGRTMVRSEAWGRHHNAHFNTGLILGPHVRGGVVGGLQGTEGDFAAMPFDSRSGTATDDGDITPAASLASWGKTLGAALGLPVDYLNEAVGGGKVIGAALKTYT